MQASPQAAAGDALLVLDLRTEYLVEPLGLDEPKPRLSWTLAASQPASRAVRQTAYHIRVTRNPDDLPGEAQLWDSGVVESDVTTHIEYAGQPLSSRLRCHWCVRVRNHRGEWSDWSRPASWTMGLLNSSDWHGAWIGTGESSAPPLPAADFGRAVPADNTMPDPWLRRVFTLPAQPVRATAFIASVGYHELFVNGRKGGDAVLMPGVTDNSKRARYVSYEIAPLLSPGENVLALWLGTGWSIFPVFATADKPRAPIVRGQFDFDLPDGSTRRVATDRSWKTHPSPNRLTGIWYFMNFGGEHYDAGQEIAGWAERGLDESRWKSAVEFSPNLILSAEKSEPNRLLTPMRALAVETSAPNEYRVDFGRNFSGWMEIDVRGRPGDAIEFLFSERAEEAVTHRLRSRYIIGPNGHGTFRNRFNYCSGRWLTVRGLRAKPAASDFRGWLIRTDFAPAAGFQCSQPLLNRINEVTLWTLENLALGGYLVDCPHRERMGYGGDGQASITTALSHYSIGALCGKWSEDWRDVQGRAAVWSHDRTDTQPGGGAREPGNLPYTAPTYWGGGGPAWSGFCVDLAWETYLRYGDLRILRDNFPTIERWLGFLETKTRGDRLQAWGGDWDFLSDWMWPEQACGKNVPTRETAFFNNCYWIHSLQIAAGIARLLGCERQAQAWATRAAQARQAVHLEFSNADGDGYASNSQACLALALLAAVPPENLRPSIHARLEREILARDGHIHAGITGGAFLFKALMQERRDDLIHLIVGKTSYPGWGHMLEQGATTLWEDWSGRTDSRLHSSFLYVGAWFIHGVLGIQPHPAEAGFRKFIIRPGVVGTAGLTWARGHYDSIHGRIAVAWAHRDGRFELQLQVPPNTTAQVHLPVSDRTSVKESDVVLEQCKDIRIDGFDDQRLLLTVESGDYRFTSIYERPADAVATDVRLRHPAPTA
jgi:alpha-L-rhamnosidase